MSHQADTRVRTEPIRYVEGLARYYGAMGHPPYRWTINEDAPWHPLAKPVNQCRVTMLTSGGISLCSLPGFDPMARNDHRLDEIPLEADAGDFQIHDSYYDHRDADRDINCQFPIDRLRELAEGERSAVSRRVSGAASWAASTTAPRSSRSPGPRSRRNCTRTRWIC